MDQIIAANYLLSLDKCLEQLGVTHFLSQIGFDPQRVQDPNAFISNEEFAAVIRKAYVLSEQPALGLLFGRSLSISTHGFLGYAAMSSPTLGLAIETMVRFINTRTSLLNIELVKDNRARFYVQLSSPLRDADLSRFFIEMVIAHLANMRSFLIQSSKPLPCIELNYPEPDYSAAYREILNTEINFSSPFTKVWFAADEFDVPVCFADDASFKAAKTQLQQLADQLSSQQDLPSQIKSFLMNQDLLHSNPDEIAGKLCMSPRTMRRHLQQHQVSYQDLLDEVRKAKAEAYMLNQNMSVTEIGYALGFHDTSNFSKAFKRWTGISPSEYKLKLVRS